jgi:hypothetical protein
VEETSQGEGGGEQNPLAHGNHILKNTKIFLNKTGQPSDMIKKLESLDGKLSQLFQILEISVW